MIKYIFSKRVVSLFAKFFVVLIILPHLFTMFTLGTCRLGIPFEYYYFTSANEPYMKNGVSGIYFFLDLLVYYAVAVIFFVIRDKLKHRTKP